MTKNSSFDKLMSSLDGDDSTEPAAIGTAPESEADLDALEADFEAGLDALEAEPKAEAEPEAELEVPQEQPKVETKPKRATKRVAPPENITQSPTTEPSTKTPALTTKHAEPIDEFAGLSPQTRKEMELGRQRVEALQRR